MNQKLQAVATGVSRLCPLFATTIVALLISLPAVAQEKKEVFEEIVVLATKRAENILDVPVAVSTLSGAQIQEAGIKDVWDLQQNVPGLLIGRSQTTTTSNFNIRGIGSTSNNFGVESSVGLYVDGVYRSRQSSMINDLIDVEAVEVLRGPQGTLFGKNTAAGAVTIRTVRPSQERDAFVDVTYGNYDLVKVSAAANIPLTDSIAFRGTIYGTKRNGIADDLVLGKDLYNDRDRQGARLQLAVNEPSDDFNLRLIADWSKIDEACCVAITRVDSLYYKGSLANPATISPGSEAVIVALGGTVFATYPYPQPLLDAFAGYPGTIIPNADFNDYTTAMNTAPKSENTDKGLSLEINKRLSDSVTLKSITAVRAFDTTDAIDADFSNVDLIGRVNDANQSSVSQEFQFNGDFGNNSSWVAGAYYFGQTLDSTTQTSGGAFLNAYVTNLQPSLQDLIDNVNLIYGGLELAGLGGLLNPATDPFPAGANSLDKVKQDHSSYAVFGQVDYRFNDQLLLTLGARYTHETKDMSAVYTQTANGPQPDLRPCSPDPNDPTGTSFVGGAICVALSEAGAFLQTGGQYGSLEGIQNGDVAPVTEPNVAWGMYLFDPFAPRPDVKDSISDGRTTGTVKLSWFPSDSTMLYASYATGYKAGGTNTDRINPAFDQTFDAETSKSMEGGLKGQYGPVQLVLTLYKTDFNDFQANSFTGTGFNLQNAGDLTIKGAELELLWRPTDSTQVEAWYAHNEGTYDRFENGTAWDTWVYQYGIWEGVGDPGCPGVVPVTPADNPESCSRSGEKIPYNPENRAFLALTQDFELGGSTSMFARLEFTRVSDQTTDGDNDPLTRARGLNLVNARLGLNFERINSTLTVWGRNITNEHYYYGSFDVPVAYDKMLSYPGEPATYGVSFHKNFD
jgi:iron complex outermembrane recepter protein